MCGENADRIYAKIKLHDAIHFYPSNSTLKPCQMNVQINRIVEKFEDIDSFFKINNYH